MLGNLDVALTGRYLHSVVEETGNKLNRQLCTEIQLTYRPVMIDRRLGLTVGVNNLSDKGPPACFTCSVNNYDLRRTRPVRLRAPVVQYVSGLSREQGEGVSLVLAALFRCQAGPTPA